MAKVNSRSSRKVPHPAEGSANTSGLEKRIEDQRNEMFGAMAIVAVARDSVSSDENYDLHRALDDAYDQLYRIAGELNNISCDVAEVQS